jgi:hypothetical protein
MQTPQHIGTMQTLTNLASNVRTLLRDLYAEMARLNRAGVTADSLKGRSRRERARLVKRALAARHHGHTRCC